MSAQLAFRTDFASHARHLRRERGKLVHHRVDDVFDLKNFAAHVHGDFLGQVTGSDGGCHLRHVAQLHREIRCHEIDVVGQIFPRTGDAFNIGLTAELPFRTDLPRHARHLRREGRKLVHHRVDGVLQFQDLAFDPYRDFFREITVGDCSRHRRNVADLRGEIRRHRIHRFGQVFPRP